MVQLNIDCEGPITQNDNAFELCEELLPGGGRFFARVSRYDDYLADVERRPGYKAGDTLKLILPFLKAFGATDRKMEEFSKKSLVLLRGAAQMLPRVASIMPTFIISTSYEPYLKALCRATGFPEDQVYCTRVNLDRYPIAREEAEELRGLEAEIAGMPPLEWPDGAGGPEDLQPGARALLERMDEIFWDIIPSMGIGALLDEVSPVGGAEKARAVEHSLGRTGQMLSDVIYVGDSITDVQALELVSQGGGIPISFNGNGYAIRAARWACMSEDTAIIGAIARLVQLHGTSVMEELCATPVLEGKELLDALREKGVETKYLPSPTGGPGGIPARLVSIKEADLDHLVSESEAARRRVRGAGIGGLG